MIKLLFTFLVCFNLFAIESPYDAGKNSSLTEFSSILGDSNSLPTAQTVSGPSGDGCRTAHFIYDAANMGGAIGTVALGIYLPAKAVIRQSFFHTKTSTVSALDGKLQFYCEDSENIKATVSSIAFVLGAYVAGESDGAAASTFKDDIAARCQISVAISSGAFSAGFIDGYVDYCGHN